MTNESEMKDRRLVYKMCEICIVGIVLCLIIALLTGCRSIQYVPVPEYHTDSVYLTKVQFDSIYAHDSVYIREYVRGDTVYLEHTKWHTKYKEVAVHDTSYIERIDSVSVPYPVERQPTRWERIRLDYGGHALIMLLVLLLIIFCWFIKKFAPRWQQRN